MLAAVALLAHGCAGRESSFQKMLIDGFGLGREFIAATGRTCPWYITDLKPNESSAFLSSVGVEVPVE
jgi:hypothetical protein